MLAVSLAVVSAAAMVGGPDLMQHLRYERSGILSGEVWRMLTAHIAHLGWEHLALNIAGLALLWMMFARLLSIGRWAIVVAGSGLGVSAGLLAFNPELHWYVGMSGLLHGMFVAGAVAGIQAGYRFEWALLGLVAVKLAWERISGAATATEEIVGGSVVIDSHLYGAIAGLLVMLAIIAFDRMRAAPPNPA
jgi:rhomboid family GlyGly-CTERM serine protease